MPDIRRWAEVVAHFVRPGGRFYITEIHPVANSFENEGVAPGELQLVYPYWEHRAPLAFDNVGSYADPDAPVTVPKEFGWDHGLGEIVTALIDAGLRIESLREYPFVDWKLDFLDGVALTARGGYQNPSRASCRCSSRSWRRSRRLGRRRDRRALAESEPVSVALLHPQRASTLSRRQPRGGVGLGGLEHHEEHARPDDMHVESLEADGVGHAPCGQGLEDLVPGPDPPVRTELDERFVEDRLVAARDRGLVTTHERQLEGAERLGVVHRGYR